MISTNKPNLKEEIHTDIQNGISYTGTRIKDHKHCYYCGRQFVGEIKRTRDHVIPRVLGGGNAGNIVIACTACNTNKGGLLLHEWETRLTNKTWLSLIPDPWLREKVPIILNNIRRHPAYNPLPISRKDEFRKFLGLD